MFQRILVPVDLGDDSVEAVRFASDLAAVVGARVRLFHVIETIPGVEFDEEEEFFGRLEERARAVLLERGNLLDRAGVDWDSEIVYGKPGPRIVQRARDMDADLLLLGSHRIDPEAPSGVGTLSHQVAMLADRPVLLVK